MWSFLGLEWLVALAACAGVHADDAPQSGPPAVRELWVPSEHLDAVLKKFPRAVMLDREQYAALLRDSAGDGEDADEDKSKPPQASVVGQVAMTGELHDEVATIRATWQVEIFVEDQWVEIPLVLPRQHLAKISVDGDGVGAVRQYDSEPHVGQLELLVRGVGKHKMSAEFHLPIERDASGKSIQLTSPGVAAARLDLAVAKGIELDSDLPFSVQGTTAHFVLPATAGDHAIRWAAGNIAPIPEAALFQTCRYLYSIDTARVQGDLGLVLSSNLRDLPIAFAIALPAEVRLLSVEGSELLRWDRDEDGKVQIHLVPGKRRAADLRLLVEAPVDLGEDSLAATIALPVATVEGVHRASGTLALIGSDDVKVQTVETGPLTVPTRDELDPAIRDHPQFVSGFRFPVLSSAPTVTLSPVAQRFNAQLDTAIRLERDAIHLRRELTVVPLEGRLFETIVELTAGEEISTVRWKDEGSAVELNWDRNANAADGKQGLRIEWPGGLVAGGGRAVVIESRRDPEDWFSLGEEAAELNFSSATIAAAEAVSGYVAVAFGESFRVETADVSGLDARDARTTPVSGQLAWFRLRDYSLDLRVARRAPEYEAVVTAYGLPLQNTLEIEGQIDLDIRYTSLAKLVVSVPAEVAEQLRFDSPLIAEKTLDKATGKWTLTFHQEPIGQQRLRFHLSVPYAEVEMGKDGMGGRFQTQVPLINIDGVKRLTGQWLVEANTDTELSFEALGMDEIDLLRAPVIEAYSPRHRVIAAYEYRGSDYQLSLSGTRHEAAELIAAVVDDLQIDSVLSTDGLDRHQARIRLRAAGEQFLEVGLPDGADLWTLTVDGEAVKPVTSSAGTLRIALPSGADGRAEVDIRLIYQLRRKDWAGSGRRDLEPVRLSKKLPVMHADWRLHLPEGFDYQSFHSNLSQRFEITDRTLLGQAAKAWGSPSKGEAAGVAEGAMELGDYDVAEKRYLQALADDPTNEAARLGLEKVEQARVNYYEMARDQTRAKFLKEVEKGWELPEPQNALLERKPVMVLSDSGDTGVKEIETKLKSIILPSVEFLNTPLREALDFLTQKSAELDTTEVDPSKKGMNIILSVPNLDGDGGFGGNVGDTEITLKLKNVPLVEAIRYTTALAQLKYKVEPHAIVVVPSHTPDAELYTNVYRVPPTFLNSSGADAGGGGGPVDPFAPAADSGSVLMARPDAKAILERAGVTFGEGSAAIYNPQTNELIVRNSQDQMELVEAYNESLQGEITEPERETLPSPRGSDLTASDMGAFRQLFGGQSEQEFRDSVNYDRAVEFSNIDARLRQSILPSVEFNDTPLAEALQFLAAQSGVPIENHATDSSGAKITLKLSHVPTLEALHYTTSLAQTKFRVTESAVAVVPLSAPEEMQTLVVEVQPNLLSNGLDSPPMTARDLLERAGVTFANGAGAAYNRSTQRLAVKNTQDQLELVEAYFLSKNYVVDRGRSREKMMRSARGESVQGLIPIDFELPKAGRVYRFEGSYAPEALRFRYVNWDRQVRVAWWWILFGALAFVFVALRWGRPWFCGALGVAILAFVPLALMPSLMTMCNALMIGWLTALGLLLVWRVANAARKWQQREALRARVALDAAEKSVTREVAS